MRKDSAQYLPIVILLCALTLAVYAHVTQARFLKYDDEVYVMKNSQVKTGLSADNIRWAFGSTVDSNWIPITWISLMIDHTLSSGSSSGEIDPSDEVPGVYHRTNLVLHILNTLLLFAVLVSMTGCKWRSAAVAALFAVHPMHVQSVAWVAERKDVLSTFFAFAALWGYVWYSRRRSLARYIAFAAAFALGLMAKSMIVTLPLVMLLMDIWPLKRVGSSASGKADGRLRLSQLIFEKLPLLGLSLAVCIITLFVQISGGATQNLLHCMIGVRLANAAVSGVTYVWKMVWPANLAYFYPHPGRTIPTWSVIGCAALLLVWSGAAVLTYRKRPYVLVGWLWYVITVLPVIGIIQVGGQAMADRYTYIPYVGLFVVAVWGAYDLVKGLKHGRTIAAIAGLVAVLSLAVVARQQVSYWHDDYALCDHALTVTTNNADAHYTLAIRLVADQRFDEAMIHLQEVARIDPRHYLVWGEIGTVYALQNRFDKAGPAFVKALKVSPRDTYARLNYGVILREQGKYDEAIAQLREIPKDSPDYAFARDELEQAESAK